MTDRDTFAAAALTGLLSNIPRYQLGVIAVQAYDIADEMLRERGNYSEKPNSSTNHDAAPAARAEDVLKEPNGSSTGEPGGEPESTVRTGNAQEPVAWAVEVGGELEASFCGAAGREDAADWREQSDGVIVPLYRHPAEPCPYVTGKTTRYCTLTPFTLTDEEREAIKWCRDNITAMAHPSSAFSYIHADTLRNLLERLHT